LAEILPIFVDQIDQISDHVGVVDVDHTRFGTGKEHVEIIGGIVQTKIRYALVQTIFVESVALQQDIFLKAQWHGRCGVWRSDDTFNLRLGYVALLIDVFFDQIIAVLISNSFVVYVTMTIDGMGVIR
jgi:hypothetical protein